MKKLAKRIKIMTMEINSINRCMCHCDKTFDRSEGQEAMTTDF
ncbi:hypothetical protein PV797_18835 [Clostridiaceae bacterium M8S5]|nr:hypothetical protein PV797_18835 [Clostridiaceae bacterium M8S5]